MTDEPTKLIGAAGTELAVSDKVALPDPDATELPTIGPVGGPVPAAAPAPPPAAVPFPVVPSLHGIEPGALLVNTYRVERLLGGGGMGEVYLARHTGLDTLHAVKVIRPAMAADRKVMDLFFREAKVLRGVRHDAVVSYDGFVRDSEGRYYLVMEYVDGPSLKDRLGQGPLTIEEVLTLRDRLVAGLSEAHHRGAVHRDISPDNVVLPGNQVANAKLIDFGLSKLTDPTQATIIGDAFAGKFRYASPEQFGMFGGAVDGRSDMYSLGLILAAAAQGAALDMGNTFSAALQSRQQVPDLSGVPAILRPWLAAMLEPDPARRPADFAVLLSQWPASAPATSPPVIPPPVWGAPETASPVTSTPVTPPPMPSSVPPSPVASSPTPWTQGAPDLPRSGAGSRRPLMIGGGAVLVLAIGLGLWIVLSPLETTRPPAPPPIPGAAGDAPPPVSMTGGRVPGPAAPGGDPGALVKADRLDEAFRTAQARLANPPPGGLPAGDLLTLTEQLLAGGRTDDAFVLAEALIGAGTPPPAATLWTLAQGLRNAGRLDPYFFIVRTLAGQGDGPAAFALAEMYDPLHWSAATSPLPNPRPGKARDWYERARELGVPEAEGRLKALRSLGNMQ